MAAKPPSIDEFLSKRAGSTKAGDVLVKGHVEKAARFDKEARSARFVMSSESVDRDGDVIAQAGLNIEGFLKNPQGLLFHYSRGWPVGSWGDVEKVLSGRPKRTEGTLTLLPKGADEGADRAAVHLEHGTIRAVSIGFIPKTIDYREEEIEGRKRIVGFNVLEAELVECSLVPIPAQPDALMKGAAGDEKLARELLEHVLDTWVKLPSGAIVPRADYEAALKTLTGERTGVIVKAVEPPPAATEGDEPSWLGKLLTAITGLKTVPVEPKAADEPPAAVEPPAQAAEPPVPTLPSAEERAAAIKRFEEVEGRVSRALAA